MKYLPPPLPLPPSCLLPFQAAAVEVAALPFQELEEEEEEEEEGGNPPLLSLLLVVGGVGAEARQGQGDLSPRPPPPLRRERPQARQT